MLFQHFDLPGHLYLASRGSQTSELEDVQSLAESSNQMPVNLPVGQNRLESNTRLPRAIRPLIVGYASSRD